MTELETLEMLERCLEILVAATPQCKECEMRWYDGERYLCHFAACCFCEKDSYLKFFKKKGEN